jgi:steroid 5-alpha reductase family enzyme
VPRGYTQAELDRGFLASGLWGYSRHPNFAAEQTIWIFFYQWSCYATKSLYSWAAFGPTFLVLLFQGSTWLTELITSGKYPEYSEYQRRVGMFAPTSFSSYKTPVVKPKIIRTSELAKKQNEKERQNQKHKQT